MNNHDKIDCGEIKELPVKVSRDTKVAELLACALAYEFGDCRPNYNGDCSLRLCEAVSDKLEDYRERVKNGGYS